MEKYLAEERMAKFIQVDIANVIVVSLAHLNRPEKTQAFKKALKNEKAVRKFTEK